MQSIAEVTLEMIKFPTLEAAKAEAESKPGSKIVQITADNGQTFFLITLADGKVWGEGMSNIAQLLHQKLADGGGKKPVPNWVGWDLSKEGKEYLDLKTAEATVAAWVADPETQMYKVKMDNFAASVEPITLSLVDAEAIVDQFSEWLYQRQSSEWDGLKEFFQNKVNAIKYLRDRRHIQNLHQCFEHFVEQAAAYKEAREHWLITGKAPKIKPIEKA